MVHVEVTGHNYQETFREGNVVEAVYGPAAVISSSLVVHIHYNCGGVWWLVYLQYLYVSI